jgi:hypothetical protein
MRPVWGHEAQVVPLVMRLCGLERDFGECQTLAFVNNENQLVGGLVFHNWNPESGVIEVSVGSIDARWLTRSIMNAGFDYAYDTCRCHAVFIRTDENNPSRRIWKALGADEHVIPYMRGPNESEYTYVLPRWVWERSKFARHNKWA